MRSAVTAALALLCACKTDVTVVDAAPVPSASVPVIESPATAMPSAAPAASIACARDADCDVVRGPCCNAWPSNVASRAQVKQAIQAADAERCKNRLCVMMLLEAKCERGACAVHPAPDHPFGF